MKIALKIILGILAFGALSSVFEFVNSAKFEGRSAKDWYYDSAYWQNRYQNLKSCVEDKSHREETVEEVMRGCL